MTDSQTTDQAMLIQELVKQSTAIVRHVDLFLWMQGSVRQIFPHDVMIAAWGDFHRLSLHYDVISSIPAVRTRHLIEARDNVDALMRLLYTRWKQNGSKWFTINRSLDEQSLFSLPETNKICFLKNLQHMRSLLVYGMRDLRGGVDSLYVFFSTTELFPLNRTAMDMLVPHIDSVLRRIESLAEADPPPDYSTILEQIPDNTSRADSQKLLLGILTDREIEILQWVKSGKSNQEIGMILEISHNTVKNHLKRIYDKLGVSTRLQALNRYAELLK